MSSNKHLNIGLFGFGVVGEGLYKVLKQTPSLQASIKKVVIKHPDKKRSAPPEIFNTLADDILEDSNINVVVEVIDDAEAAYHIVTKALKNGKAVVSANKKMIAEHLEELLQLQQQYQVPFLYEASVCASIPVIRNLEEYYDNDLLQSVSGIINGSTNFILTKMFQDQVEFVDAILQAQQLGFAESNPSLDVLGIDAVNKHTILVAHAYGILTKPNNILHNGIQNIQLSDAKVAAERDYQIKLIARAGKLKNGKIAAFVLPHFVGKESQLYNVANEYNGVIIESGFADQQFFYGKGAGSFPTASAVLSDIAALRYDYRYEYKKKYYHTPSELSNDFYLKVYVSFDDVKKLQKEDFEWIEEWHSGQERSYLAGVIHFDKLVQHNWWKQHGVSLIVLPEAIIENVELRSVKKRSLELAGIL
ncbi:MAG: homoserine dehydrogenase [Chitinophagaceae bacterium]|nr:homoserine dehydrogenase [Chitinophagaceae bacterium]